MKEGSGNVTEVLPVGGSGAVLVLSELENMAARQQREIAQQKRLLEQRETRLAVLRGAQVTTTSFNIMHRIGEPAQQDRLARLRHRLDQQQSKLNRLRLLRSQTDQSRANNATLTSDLDCIRALFNEKEKELSLAVAKVEELTRQLEELRGRHNNGTEHLPTPASAELEKLRRELMYRNKMNEQQNQVVSQQRLALVQRQAEMAAIDARIAQLQGRLQRKRALNQRLSQQLGSNQRVSVNHSNFADSKLEFISNKTRPAGNIAAIEPYSHIPNDDFSLNKNDPKYQTLPYNTKFAVNFKIDDDVNKNKIQHSASASQIGQRSFQQYGHQIAHSQSQSHVQGQSQPLKSPTILNFVHPTNNNIAKNNLSVANASVTNTASTTIVTPTSHTAATIAVAFGTNTNESTKGTTSTTMSTPTITTTSTTTTNSNNNDTSSNSNCGNHSNSSIGNLTTTNNNNSSNINNNNNNNHNSNKNDNNNSNSNSNGNNNNNTVYSFGDQQNLRIHNQKQHGDGNSCSGTNIVSNVAQSLSHNQNYRSMTFHQKPVSSVAPSFPVKSPIYQTSSTKIHPVMPQTLSLIGHGQLPATQGYNSNGQEHNYFANQRQNFAAINQAHISQGSGISDNIYNNQSQSSSNLLTNGTSLTQCSANLQANYSGNPFAQSQNQTQIHCQQNQQLSPNTNSSNDAQNDNVIKADSVTKIDQNIVKYDNLQSQFDERRESIKPYEQPARHDQTHGKYDHMQIKYEQQQLKFDHSAKYNENNQLLAKYEHVQSLQQFKQEQSHSIFDNAAGHMLLQNSKFDHHTAKYDHPTKFELSGNKLPDKSYEYERLKYDSDRRLTRGDDKIKPALPPKPNKPNPPPRLIHHEKVEVSSDIADGKALVVVGARVETDEDIPPIPTSEPPESPTDVQSHQIIKARPLALKKASLADQPKLRYSKSNVHVSINRRIEMPPAFLFPETEIPADLMQSDQIELPENSGIKRRPESAEKVDQLEQPNNERPTEECDIVDALNVLNADERQPLQGSGEKLASKGTGNNNNDMVDRGRTDSDQHQDCSKADVIRRKKGNLKSTTGKANVSRRVSFDPLALLLDASLEGELELVKKTAKEVANPSSANDEGITALHNAICAGHLEIVKFLVEFGCDVNAQDSDGWTPLHCAASCNNLSMVRFLVEHGACIFATTLSDHETAAEKCEEDEEGFDGCSEYLYSVQEKLGIMNNGQVYAVFDYDAQHSDELSLKNGDSLVVVRKGDDNEREWWWSKLAHREGYVPRNLLGLYARVQPAKMD
ncbi:apoptosis-stimulating of p53 protein 1 isoform X2 [Neodiprion pinetum]|nr:apoptosis-stimulating of p53 protein 1-like isoform X2 [Neodiprion pinetum]XP_046488885.1 apoptosis-stimulating of p53 protein 1-like isoform X2 [Neodiprion pinetum]